MILITGNKGFIGSRLANRLRDKDLYFIDNYQFNLDDVPWDKIKKVYHIGAISSTTETNFSLLYEANIKFTLDLFHICFTKKIPITYASSASVYGNSHCYSINPLNYYAITKATIDYKAEEYIKLGADVVGLRFFNVYGRGEEHKGNQASPVHQFTKQALETGIIKVFEGSKSFKRDFIWVEDVVDCILTDKMPGIYDLGTSTQLSFYEVAEMIAKKYSSGIAVVPFPEHLYCKYQLNTIARKCFDKNFISVRDFLESS